jgi:long-chain acyl-CoA synthetase
MIDWAIWMAGYVSVPLYPTLAAETIRQILEHSDAQLLFVGKLDGWEGMKSGVPAGMPCISTSLSPQDAKDRFPLWEDIVAKTEPLVGDPVRGADELCTIMYTVGHHRRAQGRDAQLRHAGLEHRRGLEARAALDHTARMMSYLPLSHIANAILVEHGLMATGMQVWFAESLETFTLDLQRAKPTCSSRAAAVGQVPATASTTRCRRPRSTSCFGCRSSADWCERSSEGARPGPMQFRRRRRGADAPDLMRWYNKLGLDLVEGLWHDRERRHFARHAAGQAAPGHGGPCLTTACRAGLTRPTARSRCKRRRDARLLQGAGPDARTPSPKTAGSRPATRAASTPKAT